MKIWQVVSIFILSVIWQIEGFSLSESKFLRNNNNGIQFKINEYQDNILTQFNDEQVEEENDNDDDDDDDNDNGNLLENEVEVFSNIDGIYGGRIIGGQAGNIEKFPYQISLQVNRQHACGGTIISKNIILTAAHCVIYPAKARFYTIRAGSTEHDRLGEVLGVSRIITHPQYSPITNDFDLAILILANNLVYSNKIQPAKLPDINGNDFIPNGTELVVSGWGVIAESNLAIPRVLRFVAVNLINHSVCRSNYKNVNPITIRMICASALNKDSCQGDSGGPLVRAVEGGNYTIYGVVSFGIGCASNRFPGVYTNVFSLTPWINTIINTYKSA